MNITPTSLTITQALSATREQYVVPSYQRRYSWRQKQLEDLLEDIELLEPTDTHLLGSVVCLTGAHTAGLVDGQQRLTTVCILLHCIHERLTKLDPPAAQEVAPLLAARAPSAPPVPKIDLDSLDRQLFERLLRAERVESPENAELAFAFERFRGWVAERDAPELARFLYRLKDQVKLIRLDVSDAKDAFKLFETINNRGLRLSPTDIIKNFLLGNAARFGATDLDRARERWAELIVALDGVSTETFFRHFLSARLQRRVTKSFVVITFKRVFMREVAEALQLPERQRYVDAEPDDEPDEGPEEDEGESNELNDDNEAGTDAEPVLPETARVSFADFLEDLVGRARLYGEIVRASTGKEQIDRRLRHLRMIKAVQTYGFLSHLRAGGCSDADFEKVLQLTESFLLRRHICRMRTSETEIAFAKLCGVDCSGPLAGVAKTYREYSPSDERFREDFATAKFAARLVDRARYCLAQFEVRLQGKHLELVVGGPDIVHVEHIIPKKIKTRRARRQYGDWPEYLGPKSEARHPKYVWRIGNLTLFSGTLNIGASNNPYHRKKKAYSESALKITNSLPAKYPEFRFDQVEERSAALAETAVALWPVP